MNKMNFNYKEVQELIGYEFKNKKILLECFTHASYTNEHKSFKNYERLEFLGDSVLGFLVSDYLYNLSDLDEGKMTAIKQKLVSSKPLYSAIKKIGVQKYLITDENVPITDKMCENLFESIVGGIYLDGGLENAKNFIVNTLTLDIYLDFNEDYKSKINEFASKNKLGVIKYETINKLGQEHEPIFVVQVSLNDKILSRGTGTTKKSAQQNAAELAYKTLIEDGNN